MKYNTLAEEVLDFLAGDRSWAEDQSGDVEAPTGWFALLDVPDREAAAAGLDSFIGATDMGGLTLTPWERDKTLGEMVGAWIVSADSQGFAYFESFGSWSEAERAFAESVERFDAWSDQDEEGDL